MRTRTAQALAEAEASAEASQEASAEASAEASVSMAPSVGPGEGWEWNGAARLVSSWKKVKETVRGRSGTQTSETKVAYT